MKRALRPRTTLAIAPVAMTDLSAPAVVGLEPRVFRETVRDLRIPHVRRGQRVLVDVEVFRAAIASAAKGESATADEGPDDEHGPSATDLLARCGRVRRAG